MSKLMSKYGYRYDSPFKNLPYINIKTPNGTIDMSKTPIDLRAYAHDTGKMYVLPAFSGLHNLDSKNVTEFKINPLNMFKNRGSKMNNRKFQYGGIQDILNAKGVDGSYRNRKKLFDKYFNGQYTGSAEQNIKLMDDLQSGKVNLSGNINNIKSNVQSAPLLKRPTQKLTTSESKISPVLQSNNVFKNLAVSAGKNAKQNVVNTPTPQFKKENINPTNNKVVPKSNWLSLSPEEMGKKVGSADHLRINTGNPVVDRYARLQYLNGQKKYWIIDKGTKTEYFGDPNNNQKIKIGTGLNDDPNAISHTTTLAEIERLEKQGKFKEANALKVTPIGNFKPRYSKNIYGKPAYWVEDKNNKNLPIANHVMYGQQEDPQEYIRRQKLLDSNKSNFSYGCINVDDRGRCVDGKQQPSDLDRLLQYFDPNQTDLNNTNINIIDTRLPIEKNDNAIKGMYQLGGLNDCPEGYMKDQSGNCVEDFGFNISQYLKKGTPIVQNKNVNGQIVGGTNALQPTTENPVGGVSMQLKRAFGTPNIPNIIGTNLLSFGLSTFANSMEQGRQKAFMLKQMNDPNFNGSYSNAQNDYGVDPYEQTGQLRQTFQKGGNYTITNKIVNEVGDRLNIMNPIDQMVGNVMNAASGPGMKGLKKKDFGINRSSLKLQGGGKFNPISFLYDEDRDNESTVTPKEVEKSRQKRITDQNVENGDDELSALGLSAFDIVNMNGPLRRNLYNSGSKLKAIGPNHGGSRNNYGNLMTRSGQYRNFDTPEEGRSALINQLDLYQTGKTKTGVNGNFTLSQAMNVYASDGGNSYPAFIAKKLGISVNTPIKSIDKNKWADAIAKFEGNKNIDTKHFKAGGTYLVDFATIRELQTKGIKFKLL